MEISGHVAVNSNQNKVVQENSQMETVDGPKAAQAQSIDNALVVETPLTKEEVDKANRKDTESSATDFSQTHPALPFYKLFVFATSYDYLLMTLGTLGAIAHGLALPIFFLFFGSLINSFGAYQNDRQKTYHEVSKYALNFVYLGLAAFVSSWIEVACWMETGERQVGKMRIEYLKALLRQDVSFFDTQVKTGDIVDSISTNTVIVQEAISEKLGNFIHFFSTFVGGFIVGLTIVWQMGLLTLAVVPVIALFGGIFAMSLTGLTSKSHTAYAEAGSIAEQAISQVRTVYSFVGEAKVLDSYSMALKSALKLAYEGGAVKGIGVGALYGMLFCSWALLLWYGGVLVRKGSAEGGKVLSSIFAVLIGGVSLGTSVPNLAAFAKASSAGYKILEMIDQKPMINKDSLNGTQLSKLQGQIDLRNVKFSYPARPNVQIFEDFSLSVPSGKTVAIVGSSGCGKSTVISLIERFYDPISGEVLVDGHNIKTLQLTWLRAQMGLVNQEPSLFATSIQDNILYGNQGSSFAEVEIAAKAANVHSFVVQLPDGYNTQVGDRGVQLSGGQKQRVAIARAMLKNPTILLLDEATSALDAESEHVVQDALDKVMLGRTTVIVAHRLSTVQNVDCIAVVQNGRVAELGSHEDLIKRDGAYASLVRLQEMAKSQTSTDIQRLSSVSRDDSIGRKSQNNEHPGSDEGRFASDILSCLNSSWRRNSSLRHSSTVADESNRSTFVENDENQTSKYYIWRLMKLNAPEWRFGLMGTLGAMLAGIVNPTFAFIIGQILHVYYDPDNGHMKREIRKYVIVYLGLGAVTFIAYCIEHYFFGITGENLTKRVREMMLTAILRNEIGWFDQEENSSTQMASRLASDATNVRAAVGDRISIIVQNFTLVTAACTIAFFIQWQLSIVVFATFPLLVGASFCENLFLKGFAGDIAKAHYRATMLAGEAVSNIRTVAAFNAEEKVVQLVSQELVGPRRSSFLRGHATGFGYGVSSLLMFWSYGLGLWYGAVLIKHKKGNFGDVIKSFFVLVMTAFAVAETISLTPEVVKSSQALTSVFKILDRESKINPEDPQAEQINNIKGDIELKRVEFHYPSRPEVIVFRKLSFKVYSGQNFALVGASGSGKSSVITLIQRFYDPVSGYVMIDGKDIRKLNLKSLRKHIGLVQQEPVLFASTIYENILFGKEDASESEITEAAKAANAHNFISSLPDGYKTYVGERGVQLSGGQKQRVAIARAVLKNPAILLLDEATSALDAESEHVVQEALDRLMHRRTSIIIAHRLSTIRNSNKIAVMEDGGIIEQGNHFDLLKKSDGAYSKLIKLQQAQR